jgi:hypothetical protein
MRSHRKTTAPLKGWLVATVSAAILMTIILFARVLLRPARTGPKLIEADGATYFACGGALWLPTEGTFKDPDAISYNVLFKDTEGRTHELKRVRKLKVTDLPTGAPACARSQ